MKPTPLKYFTRLLDLPGNFASIILGVCIDSRKIEKGDLYFALTGNRVDGHDFLEEVAKKGAVAAVVKNSYTGPNFGLELLFVPDVIVALHTLGSQVMAGRKGKVVGITGSIGKTTTKEFTADLLKTSFSVARSPLSYNSQATLPLSILKFDGDEEIFVLEMGMSEKGEIAKLVSIAPPDIALITTVSAQHTNSFPDGILGVEKEKAALFSHPKTRIGILNRDMSCFERVRDVGSCKKITFSTLSPLGDYRLEVSGKGVVITDIDGKKISFPHFLPVLGHYQNFLGAAIIARQLNVPWEEIQRLAPTLKLPPMRFERVEKQGIVFINDAYNANPEATAAALKSLPQPEEGCKKIAVLSEMNALGVHNEEGHMLVAVAAFENVDEVICIGKNCEIIKNFFEKNNKIAHLVDTKEALLSMLKMRALRGDVVLIKGARAYALEEILARF
jgi:UDP-N-acetylmuramoyl-tripeptide--D-alanyl-D-alanine ligase